MTVNFTVKQFEFNAWANAELIQVCSTLDAAQLKIEVAGVVGSIQPTIAHLVRAEGAYLGIFNGERPWVPEPDWDNMSIDELLERVKVSGAMLIDAAKTVDPATIYEREWHGKHETFNAWVILLQAAYHGIEHRTHLKVLLTHLGVEHPELAGWDFGEA